MIPDEIHVGDIVRVIGHNGSIPWDPYGDMNGCVGDEFLVTKVTHSHVELDTPLDPDHTQMPWHWSFEDVELVNSYISELVEPNYVDFEMLFK